MGRPGHQDSGLIMTTLTARVLRPVVASADQRRRSRSTDFSGVDEQLTAGGPRMCAEGQDILAGNGIPLNRQVARQRADIGATYTRDGTDTTQSRLVPWTDCQRQEHR